MLHHYMSLIYEIPIGYIFLAVILIMSAWTVVAYFFESKVWFNLINKITLVFTAVAVFMITLVFRSYEVSGISLAPFSVFVLAQEYPDVYIQMILNIVLFVPLGLSAPYILHNRAKHPITITVVFAVVLSLIIEILQYIFVCGYSEVDDIILNTLGAVIGTVSYVVFMLFTKNKVKQGK